MIHADNSAENAVERFEDGDNNFGVDVSINDGVDTQACNAASGITTSGTTGNFATTVLRGGDNNFGVDVSIDDGVNTQACNAASGITTSGTTGNFATTVLRGGDNNFGVDVSIDDGVDTRACNVASGVTTSGTIGNFATTVLHGKQTLREFVSSSDSPLPCLCLAATLGMIAWLGLMMSTSSFFFFVMCEYFLLKDDISYSISYT